MSGWCKATVLTIALAGCGDLLPDVSFERMLDQPRGDAFAASPYFADGKVMQAPPAGTVPYGREVEPTELHDGTTAGSYVSVMPLPVTRALLERGQNRYEIFCAACHGVDGTAVSEVARNMLLRVPASLVTEPVRSFPVGRVFGVITHGYGLMPEYAHELDAHDRWAVVGYLRVLQRSYETPLAALPDALRKRALEVLR